MAGLDPISNVADAAARIISLFKANPSIKLETQAQLDEATLQGQIQQVLEQLAINKQEAANPNWFVAGWRPGVGWVCSAALAYSVIVQPIAQFLLAVFHWQLTAGQLPLPVLDMSLVMQILVPMLGLGALRTYEKLNSVSNNH